FRPDLAIVPITMMTTRLEACREVGAALAGAVAAYPKKVLLVASPDMTHYESDGSARKKDRKAIEKILELDPEGLHATIRQWGISMCGFAPTVAMLFAAKSLGAVGADLIDYRTSAEVSGDTDQVVGYAGVVIR
ncbi:MAG: AmmeMemoRadiSam system protein B, partial [Nitrospirae bacterium]|nr:AmmeMemoRadiSam system protein B [Nitrospirota bacterium]